MSEGRTIGEGTCACCDATVPIKVNKKGHLYYHCPMPADGGCGTQNQSRTAHGDKMLAKRVTRWRDPKERDAILGAAPAPTKVPATKPPAAKPPAEKKTEPAAKPWWEREII